MTSKTIAQSTYLLDPATRETFVVNVDSNNTPLLTRIADSKETYISEIDEERLKSFMVVLPVFPVKGDIVVSFDDGELVTGVIVLVKTSPALVYSVVFGDSSEPIDLARECFHVVQTNAGSLRDFSPLDDVVAIRETLGFPYGSTGEVVEDGDEGPLMIKNALGITFVCSKDDFREVDYTDVTFDFNVVETAAVEDAPGIDISVEDAIHLGLMSEDDAAESEVDVDVETDKAVEDSSKAFEDFFQTIFDNIFGVAPKDAEAQRQANIDTVERAMHREIDSSTKYISDANTELERKLQSAQVGLSIQMNLIGRVMASPSTSQTLQDSLQNILAGLAVCRNDVSDALRCSLDRDVETYISETSLGMMADQVEELQQ
jgi:hypothetical protein